MRSKVKRVVLCLLILFLIVSAASGEEGANSLTADGAFFFPSLETAYALPGENAFGQVCEASRETGLTFLGIPGCSFAVDVDMETKQLTVATYTFGEGVGQAQHEEQFETVAALLDKLYDPLEKSDAYGDYMMLQMMMVETDGGKTLRHARYCDEAMDIEHTLYEWDGECYHSVTFVYTNPEIPLVAQETPPASQEAEMQESPLVQPEETVIAEFPAQEYTVGSEVYFGRYEHDDDLSNGPDPLPWQVIAVEDNRALLLTRDVISFEGNSGYHYININMRLQNEPGDGSSGINWAGRTNWENSELRYSLNTDFLDEAFLPEEQKAILTTLVKAEPHPLSDAGVVGNDTQDKIFILSYSEVERYLPEPTMRLSQLIQTDRSRLGDSIPDTPTAAWHLRVPQLAALFRGTAYRYVHTCGISKDGELVRDIWGDGGDVGYRLACWVDLDAAKGHMQPVPEENLDRYADYTVGTSIMLGSYRQGNASIDGVEPIEWIIVKREGTRAMVLSKYALDAMKYSRFDTATWESSEIRRWLNDEFLKTAFTQEEEAVIAQRYVDLGKGKRNTQDKVFLMCRQDVEAVWPELEGRAAQATPYALSKEMPYTNEKGECRWWLCFPNNRKKGDTVRYDGKFSSDPVKTYTLGVRPAMWINLDEWVELK